MNVPDSIKKKTVLVLMLLLLILAGCGKEEESEGEGTYTSKTLGLYSYDDKTGSRYVVDAYGKRNGDYSIDEEGNIKSDSRTLIKAADAEEYRYVTTIISLNDTSSATVNLSKQIKAGTTNEYENVPTLFEYKVYVSPNNANHPEIKVISSNIGVAELLPNSGAESKGSDGSVTITPTEGVATIYIQCKAQGTAQITISSADESNVSLNFTIDVKETAFLEQQADTDSLKNEDIIPTTENTTGWVTGTNVRFRERPETDADVIAFYNTEKQLLILGTSTDGWVKCSIDSKVGYIKSDFVTRIKPTSTASSNTQGGIYIVNTPNPTKTPVPTATAAIADNDGLDHGYAVGSQTEQIINSQEETGKAASHTHYYVKYMVVQPTATTEGYTVYKCDCGASYKTNYKPANGS